jgi:hypothetical protein
MNQFRQKDLAEEAPKTQEPSKGKGRLVEIADFSFYTNRKEISRWLPFIFFLGGLALLYIYNSHQAIRTIRQTDEISREIKESRAEYISVKSEFMYKSKQSQVARRLEETGLKELKQPPIKISYKKEDEY